MVLPMNNPLSIVICSIENLRETRLSQILAHHILRGAERKHAG